MVDDKYITFKRADWDKFISSARMITAIDMREFENYTLDDAVVIRTRDTFAAAALHTYANSIAVAAKCIGDLMPDVSQRLQKIADYFHTRAYEADDTKSQLPD